MYYQYRPALRARMHLVTLETTEGRIAKRSTTTKGQREILTALEVREPAQILDYELPATPAQPVRVVTRPLEPPAAILPGGSHFMTPVTAYQVSKSGLRQSPNSAHVGRTKAVVDSKVGSRPALTSERQRASLSCSCMPRTRSTRHWSDPASRVEDPVDEVVGDSLPVRRT